MKNRVILFVLSAMCLSLAMLISFTNNPVVGTAIAGEPIEVSTPSAPVQATPEAPSESGSVEVSAPNPTSEVSIPQKASETPATVTPAPTSTTTKPKMEDDPSWVCNIDGNRVCGVPDESGRIVLVCSNAQGTPIRIVTDARHCA